MDARTTAESTPAKVKANVERTSDRELVVTKTINGPARLVFEAWRNPEHFKKWWVPKSAPIKLVKIEMDVRTGGTYRLEFAVDGHPNMAFFGKYLEVVAPSKIVWTNEEGGEGTGAISTVTFEERGGKTLVVMHELYPSKEALDETMAQGSHSGNIETMDQLEEFVAGLAAVTS